MRNKLAVQIKIAVLAGFAFMLMLLPPIPLFPPAPFLTYEPSDVPALICGFALGPWAGVAAVIVKELLMLLYRFDPVHMLGVPMDIVFGCTLVSVSAWLYRWHGKTKAHAAWGLFWGILAAVSVMVPINYFVYGAALDIMNFKPPFSASYYVLALCVPFNLIKGTLSGTLAFLVYKRVSEIVK